MRCSILAPVIVTFLAAANIGFSNTIYIPADQPTIQAGIIAAVDGDTVLVVDGTYTGDGNRDIDFLGKAIVVMSQNGPEFTIINSAQQGRGFYFHSAEDSLSVLEGFTISWGFDLYGGGGIYCLSSSPVILNNTVSENTIGGEGGSGEGGGIYCDGSSAPIIEGNSILANTASGETGGGICCWNSSPTIANNTIVNNEAWYGGGGIFCSNSAASAKNNILWNNSANQGKEITLWDNSGLVIDYSDVDGGLSSVYLEPDCTLNWGDGMIDADPMFVQPDTSSHTDYRLLWSSPCVDTGDPTLFDPDGTRSDMGAHFFNQDDYLTLYVTPDMTEVAPGGQLGVTYTAINRLGWSQPFWALSTVTLPGGITGTVQGPKKYTMPAHYTAQIHVTHGIPVNARPGAYNYWSGVGLPSGIVFDEDSFEFMVTE